MSIPKIIYQTWKSEKVPEQFSLLANTWKLKHPGWEYKLWTDEMNEEFIKKEYPDFFRQYRGYQANIQRVDAVRYFILYKMGGVFIDLDFECIKNIEPLIENKDCIFGEEHPEHGLTHSKEHIISNAFMASSPDHPFFAALCNELRKELIIPRGGYPNILESTGPFMLTKVYDNYGQKEEVTVLSYEHLYPLAKNELENDDKKQAIDLDLLLFEETYAVHHYAGTWWKNLRKYTI